MKRILTLIAVAVSMTSSAASFSWGSGTTAIAFDGTTLAGNATAYLVYLGTSTDTTKLFTLTATEIVGASSADSGLTSTSKRTAGRVVETYQDTTGQIANGATYGAYIVYNDGKKNWFNFSSTVYTVAGLEDDTSSLATANFEFNLGTKTEINPSSSSPSAGGGWYAAVPEPSTAMLALAGLALLIKRRRA